MNALLEAGWTIAAMLCSLMALVFMLSTAFVATLVGRAGEGRADGSLREDYALVDANRSVENR